MNEPQLSAEMRIDLHRLREIIDEFVPGFSCPGCGGGISFETGECEKCGGEMEAPNGQANHIVDTLETFLATALEEQKEHEKTVMAKSNEWWNKKLATALEEQRERYALAVEMIPESFEVENDGEMIEVKKGVSEFKQEVLAILNGKEK